MKRKGCAAFLVCVLLAALCGCGSGSAGPAGAPPAEKADAAETMDIHYREKYYPFATGVLVKGVARIGGRLLIYGSKDAAPVLGMTEYSEDSDGHISLSPVRYLDLDEPDAADEARIYGICAGGDGFFYVLSGELPKQYSVNGEVFTNEEYHGAYCLLKYAKDGAFLEKIRISFEGDAYITGLVIDQEGTPVLYGDSFAAILDRDSGACQTIPVGSEDYITSASLTKEGVIFSVQHFSSSSNPGGYLLLDVGTGELSELALTTPSVTEPISLGSLSNCQGLNGEFIVDTGLEFYECSFEKDEYEALLQWNYLEYGVGAMWYACRLSGKSFIGALNEEYMLLAGVRQVPYAERSTVNVAVITGPFSGSAAVPTLANNQSELYDYQITRYSQDEISRFQTELMAGNAPDLLIFSNNMYVDTELFEDLLPYMEADPELSADSFIPNLLDSLSSNGKLYQLWDCVSINTVAIRSSDFEPGAATPQYYSQMAAESDKYEAVFESYMSRENLLKWVAKIGVTLYTDKGNGTCSFDEAPFRDLLAWCGDMCDELPEGSAADFYVGISEALLSRETISTLKRLPVIENNLGEPYVFVGFPDGDSGFHYYGATDEVTCMAIPSGSRNKEGAWAFIKSRFTMEAQSSLQYSLPVTKEAMQRQAEAVLTDPQIELLQGLLEATKYTEAAADDELIDIILTCGQSYLAGDRSLDDTVRLIQSRAGVYMGERYG